MKNLIIDNFKLETELPEQIFYQSYTGEVKPVNISAPLLIVYEDYKFTTGCYDFRDNVWRAADSFDILLGVKLWGYLPTRVETQEYEEYCQEINGGN